MLVNGPFIEDLSEQDKMTIKTYTQQMKLMYDKLDHLLPMFLLTTSNFEATRRIVLMKHMLEDQYNFLSQDKYIFNLENIFKLRDQFNGYFNWVKNTMGGNNYPLQQQQHLIKRSRKVCYQSFTIKLKQ